MRNKKINWTRGKIRKLKKEYPRAKFTRKLAKSLGVSYDALKSKATVLGLRRKVLSGSPWTRPLERKLKKLYPNTLNADIAKELGLKSSQIDSKAFKLGLKKTEEFRLYHTSKTCYRKGMTPMNKGKKQRDFMSREAIERTKATRFKKGQRNHNELSDGDITMRCDKNGKLHYYIRIAKGVWKELQIYEWEKKHGRIRKGYILASKDGDCLNCDPSNWKLITRADNMRRNSSSLRLTDGYVAVTIVGKNNMHLLEDVLKDKKLIEAKRQLLLLKRTINESTGNSKKA